MPKKKFRRYLPNSATRHQPGKGDRRREQSISEKEMTEKWCASLGHRWWYGYCANCGTPQPAA